MFSPKEFRNEFANNSDAGRELQTKNFRQTDRRRKSWLPPKFAENKTAFPAFAEMDTSTSVRLRDSFGTFPTSSLIPRGSTSRDDKNRSACVRGRCELSVNVP